jgi:hypothetical protein
MSRIPHCLDNRLTDGGKVVSPTACQHRPCSIPQTNIFFLFLQLKTWSLTLREEHRLRVFENRVLRRIFGPKRDEVAGGWRKLHNEEWVRHVARIERRAMHVVYWWKSK